MTRRAKALDAIEPESFVEVNPVDCLRLGVRTGDWVRLSTRRGAIRTKVREGHGTPPGSIFMAFCFREAAANLLTTDALDPVGKIPEFKYCAVKVEPIPPPGAKNGS
jgi:formate dehydrogenase major subunit